MEAEAWPGPQRLRPGLGPMESSLAAVWVAAAITSVSTAPKGLTAGSQGRDGLTPTPPNILGVLPNSITSWGTRGGL